MRSYCKTIYSYVDLLTCSSRGMTTFMVVIEDEIDTSEWEDGEMLSMWHERVGHYPVKVMIYQFFICWIIIICFEGFKHIQFFTNLMIGGSMRNAPKILHYEDKDVTREREASKDSSNTAICV